MERSADRRIRTTEWEDVQYKFGNRVGKYATHEINILAQQLCEQHADDALRAYNPAEEKARDRSDDDDDDNDDTALPRCGLHDGAQEKPEGDGDGDDDDDELRALHEKRLAELRQRAAAAAAGCGVLRHVPGSSYVQEVTEASLQQWVVAVLVQPALDRCDALLHVLRIVAQRHHSVKFVALTSSETVAQLPERHLPCVLLYQHKKLVQQLTGLQPWQDERQAQLSVRSVEYRLQRCGVLAAADDDDDDEHAPTVA